MNNKGNNKRYWLRFLISGLILFILLIIFYNILRKVELIDDIYVYFINKFVLLLLGASEFLVELFGFEVVTYGKTIKIIDDFKASGIYLDRGCMGRNVMLGYASLIVVFPGKFIHKLWYVPMGLSVITIVNILRISGLAITAYCCPEYSDINHYLVFKIFAWIAIFFLWVIWFNNFSPFKKKKKSKT